MREKYIEEVSETIARSICPIYREDCDEYQPHTCTKCFIFSTPIGCLAEDLYNAGYRKQSEVLDDLEDLLIDFDEMGFCPRTTVPDPEGYAVEWKRKLVNALQGYRKQSEGEWITDEEGYVTCSNCGEEHTWDEFRPPYCDMCGARMKGGAE